MAPADAVEGAGPVVLFYGVAPDYFNLKADELPTLQVLFEGVLTSLAQNGDELVAEPETLTETTIGGAAGHTVNVHGTSAGQAIVGQSLAIALTDPTHLVVLFGYGDEVRWTAATEQFSAIVQSVQPASASTPSGAPAADAGKLIADDGFPARDRRLRV